MVLSYEDIICNSFYSYSCGGHTDTVGGVWLRDNAKYLSGRIDSNEKIQNPPDLTRLLRSLTEQHPFAGKYFILGKNFIPL